MKNIISICLIIAVSASATAQQNLDSILNYIKQNNKAIIANKQFWKAKKVEYKTGLYPENPKVEYEYFPGNLPVIGAKETFEVMQSFSFPTIYFNKQQLSKLQIEQADYQISTFRQEILLEAKFVCYELVYLNKLNIELKKRAENAEDLYNSYALKLEKGDASILDVNKAKLQLLNFQNQLRTNETQIQQFTEKLTQLNGGVAISVGDTLYSELYIKDLEAILQEMEEKNPALKSLQYDKEIALSQMKLNKSLWLPEFEIGYGSETVLNESYRGIQAGLKIPLWKNTNIVKQSKAQAVFAEYREESYRTEIISLIKQQYQKVQTLKTNLDEYRKILGTLNSIELLEKSLELGQISAIEYFLEIRYFYEIYNNYLQIEKEYYQAIAELYKFEL